MAVHSERVPVGRVGPQGCGSLLRDLRRHSPRAAFICSSVIRPKRSTLSIKDHGSTGCAPFGSLCCDPARTSAPSHCGRAAAAKRRTVAHESGSTSRRGYLSSTTGPWLRLGNASASSIRNNCVSRSERARPKMRRIAAMPSTTTLNHSTSEYSRCLRKKAAV